MKKFVALLLALIMVFALCACGNTATTPEDKSPAAEESAAPAGNGDSAAASSKCVGRTKNNWITDLPHHYR